MGWPKGKKRGPRTGVASKPSGLVAVALKMAKLTNAHLALVSEISRLDGKTAQGLVDLAGELRAATAKRVVTRTKTVTKIKHVASASTSTVKPGKPGTPAAGKKTAPKAAKAAKARPASKPKPSRSSKPSGPSGPKLKPVPAPATEPEGTANAAAPRAPFCIRSPIGQIGRA